MPLPIDLPADLQSGDVMVRLRPATGSPYALAPLFDASGFQVGGVVVVPLDRSIDREVAETRKALSRAVLAVTLLAGLVALLIGGLLTWRIIRPIRQMTSSVERIGLGEYAARLESGRADEFGRLSDSINRMAAKVEESFNSLVATDRLRRDLVANIGHDLRTPLGGILGHIEEARRRLLSGDLDAGRASLDSAERQVGYVTRLVEDLFELSLLDSDVPPLRLEPVPMGEIVQQAADAQSSLFVRDRLHLELEIQPGMPVVRADGTRLLRLLQNLLDNARKHASQGGRVAMTACVRDGAVDVTVSDDGPGISSDAVHHLFDRYYRGKSARTRQGEGTGLGLAIGRAIALAHGGELSVESEVGSGTTFRFVLPIDPVSDA
ncbi:MAG: HAMP domain-containing histidine kinase [Rhodothermales bacterium]|nr:HAMP domain-containing histidine kinase [Rhodothermales bacterium]